jgi:hypothetical protein
MLTMQARFERKSRPKAALEFKPLIGSAEPQSGLDFQRSREASSPMLAGSEHSSTEGVQVA